MRHKLHLGLICNIGIVSFLVLITAWAPYAAALDLQAVGQIGGPTKGVALQGNYAYVGAGLHLVVIDTSNSLVLREVGTTGPFPYFIEGVAVSGNLAYVAAGKAGLRVVNVSDPTHPFEVGAWDSPGYAEGVAVVGNTVYLADGPYGLSVLDVSNPAQPRQISSAYDMNYAFGVAVVGSFAYIAGAGAGLLVADVSNPAHAIEISSVSTSGYAFGVTAAGNTVYVADGWEGLRIINVADPRHPVQLCSHKTSGWAFGVAVSGNLAYVADSFNGLQVLDVSTPAYPVEVGGYGIAGGHAGGVAVAGGIAYVADRNLGLQAIDVSKPAQPAPLGINSALADAFDVTVSGNYAYMATQYYGLRIVDISDPAHPVQVGSYDADGQIDGVKVVGSYAYLAVGGGKPGAGLQVVDVSNPSRPSRTGFIEISGNVGFSDDRFGIPRDLEVVGNVAYVTNEQGLLLISVSDPTRPALLGFIMIDPWGPATVGLTVSGTRAFVVKQNLGLAIVDVSNPSTPTLMGTYNLAGTALDADVSGNLAFMVDYYGKSMQIIDVSDPTHPAPLGSCGGFSDAAGVTVSGTLVYVGDGMDGVKVVDVSNPSSPIIVGQYNTPGYARKVAVVGRYIYVADLTGGLLILEQGTNSAAIALQKKTNNIARITSVAFDLSKPQMMRQSGPVASDLYSNNLAQPSYYQKHIAPTRSERRADQSVGIVYTESASVGNCIVGSTADSGPGTFRECLNHAVNGDTITFDPSVFPPGNSAWITLSSGLPPLAQGNVTIDASNAGVIINGGNLPAGTDGIVITSDGNTIKGLQIVLFQGSGLVIRSGAKHNTIGGNRLQGSGPMGEGNLISGNKWRGVFLSGIGTDYNVVIGTYFGTDTSGQVLQPNGDACIAVGDGAQNNRIGGPTAGERNLISGCGGIGAVYIYGTGTMNNVLIGNYIGMDASGMAFLPCPSGPCRFGTVSIVQGASRNRIGGLNPGERNIISASGREGVAISDYGSMNNVIIGNYIGPNASGTAPLGNAGAGIWIQFGASNNLIQQNLISGNDATGIRLVSVGCNYNVVVGNLIGTDAAGTSAMGNDGGVFIGAGASFNKIGGKTAGERNVISGNKGWGNVMLAWQDKVESNWVMGNYIGTDVSGTRAFSIGDRNTNGVQIGITAWHNFIGGTTEAEGNVISGNTGDGVYISSGPNFIMGNYIGISTLGSGALGNQGDGISVGEMNVLIQNNTIAFNSNGIKSGGTCTIRRNSIHDNSDAGIRNAVHVPIIDTFTSTSLSGTACPGCVVEVFSDAENEGRIYEGSVVATTSGAFTFNKISGLRGPHITTTATDSSGNSSGFSTPQNINSCSFSITPTTKTFASNGGTGTVSVTTSSSICSWTAASNDPWITITSGGSGLGNGTVGYSVATNNGLTRTGTITIGGQIFTITQQASANVYFDTVQKIYIGYYQRPADPSGLIYWAGTLDSSGGNLNGIIEAFANSAESQALYGTINSSNISTVVNDLYNALVARDAEPAGLAYWVGEFNLGRITAASIMLTLLNGAQNEDLQCVNNKLAAANLFTRTIDPDFDGNNFQATYAGDPDAIAGRNFLALYATSVKVPTQAETTAYIQVNIADTGDPIGGDTAVVFSYSPIDVSLLDQIVPLGNVNGRESHVLPTDHMYFAAKTPSNPSTEIDIVAPGDIVITSLLLQTNKQAAGGILEDYAIKGRVGSDVVIIFGHISALTAELRAQVGSFEGYCNPSYVLDGNTYTQCRKNVQISVAAGEKVGVVAQQNNWTIDVNTYDQRVNLAFVNPDRSFGDIDTNENHAVCFIDYLSGQDADAMRQLLGEIGIKRTAEPVCGETMQDIAGTAQGRWYVLMAGQRTMFESIMALIHDNVDPSIGVISVGNGISTLPVGAYAFNPEPAGNVNADFSRVTADGTVYCYEPITSDIFQEYLYNFMDPNFVYAKSGVHILIQMPSAEEIFIAGVSGSKCISGETMPSQATLFVR